MADTLKIHPAGSCRVVLIKWHIYCLQTSANDAFLLITRLFLNRFIVLLMRFPHFSMSKMYYPPKKKTDYDGKTGYAPEKKTDYDGKTDYAPEKKIDYNGKTGYAPEKKIDYNTKMRFAPEKKIDYNSKMRFAPEKKPTSFWIKKLYINQIYR
jgi:hypothetical protein